MDLIRFLAAVLVMIYHLSYWDWVQPGTGSSYRDAFRGAFPITSAAWVGVPIFFVLSGFVISLSAIGRNPLSFATSRILRLYPGAWLCGLILGVLTTWQGNVSGLSSRILRSMTLWPIGPWLSDVYWTLAIEIVFYLLFFLGMLLGSRDVSIRIAWLLTLSNMTYLFARVIDRLTGGHFNDTLNFFQGPEGSLFLLSRGCYFAFGISLWARSRTGWTWSISALAICSVGTASIHLALEDLYLVHRSNLPHWWAAVPLAIWLLAVLGLIYATSADTLFDRITPALRRRVRTLGLMTYPLYLLHANVGDAVMRGWTETLPIASLLVAIGILLATCLIVVKAETIVRRGLAHVLHLRYWRKTPIAQLP
ncbi:acyltransferase [Sphingomonas sp. GC_Shp_4]|uniref:acyltransferase family protein n=1 Tax=Sphingomonas sp. GC_Shp_4 TaxID=2937382 RepID=UPI00226B60C3|nr:acyltransferase [Sphingomonas sp. GC_Shp_4]